MDRTHDRDRRPSSSPRPQFSPFPFGSPITNNDRSILSPGRNRQSPGQAEAGTPATLITSPSSVVRGRVRAQEVYGGPLIFGGNSSLRRNRLMASTPYDISQRFHNRRDANAMSKPKTSNAPTPSTSKSTTPTSDDGMSSTARLILDTLEKMSTPVRDAQKIPIVGRAEKRRQVMNELECSLSQSEPGTPSSKRRRPNLGGGSVTSLAANRTFLNGPPLRTLMSPVTTPTRSRLPSSAVKSARMSVSAITNPTSSASITATVTPVAAVTASLTTTASKPLDSFLSKGPDEVPASKSKFQMPFSVPALSGGVGSSNIRTTASDDPSPFKPTIFGSDFGKSGGKVRTKLGEKAVDLGGTEHQPDPLPAHLSNPISTGLELKQLPSFGFLQKQSTAPAPVPPAAALKTTTSTFTTGILTNSSSVGSNSSIGAVSNISSKTADTVLLSPVKPSNASSNSSSASPSLTLKTSTFKFSNPVSVIESVADISVPSVLAVNGDSSSSKKFSFSDPIVVLAAPAVGVATTTTVSSVTSNQSVMPDLTTSVTSNASSKLNAGVRPAQSLKTGSVMDILGGGVSCNHKLPDVTTSAGVTTSKVAGTSQWSNSTFKFGQNSWS